MNSGERAVLRRLASVRGYGSEAEWEAFLKETLPFMALQFEVKEERARELASEVAKVRCGSWRKTSWEGAGNVRTGHAGVSGQSECGAVQTGVLGAEPVPGGGVVEGAWGAGRLGRADVPAAAEPGGRERFKFCGETASGEPNPVPICERLGEAFNAEFECQSE